jgi:glycosyltransferase involved in cell wall biosynthesis
MRVAFVYHGRVLGGGALTSMLGLIRELQGLSAVEVLVLCEHEEMQSFISQKSRVRVERTCDLLTILGRVLVWGVSPLEWRKITTALSELLRLPTSVRSQRRLFRSIHPDIVHLNQSVLFSSAIAARLEGIPVVWHVREMLAGGPLSLRKRMAGWLIRRLATRVVAISPSTAKCLGKDRHNKVKVIYNPLDLSRFTPGLWSQQECRSRLGISAEHKVVLTLGGVSHWKGTAPLMEAMKYVDGQTDLLVAGVPLSDPDVPVRRRTRWLLKVEDVLCWLRLQPMPLVEYACRVKLAMRYAPRARIHFLGMREDVPALIAAADLLVFAGMGPHFARPIFEAWAMRKPVAVFRMSGVSNHVDDGIDGVVVKRRSGRALGLAIRALLANPERMRSMGGRGCEKAKQLMDPVESARQVYSLYQEVVSRHVLAKSVQSEGARL